MLNLIEPESVPSECSGREQHHHPSVGWPTKRIPSIHVPSSLRLSITLPHSEHHDDATATAARSHPKTLFQE